MQVVTSPVFHPYSCIVCGVNYNRTWYIDLGLRLDNAFNPQYEGAVYVCNECWWNLAEEVENKVEAFLGDNYDGPKSTILDRVSTELDREPESVDQDTERDNTEPESSDNTTSTDDLDEQADLVGSFRAFFG